MPPKIDQKRSLCLFIAKLYSQPSSQQLMKNRMHPLSESSSWRQQAAEHGLCRLSISIIFTVARERLHGPGIFWLEFTCKKIWTIIGLLGLLNNCFSKSEISNSKLGTAKKETGLRGKKVSYCLPLNAHSRRAVDRTNGIGIYSLECDWSGNKNPYV